MGWGGDGGGRSSWGSVSLGRLRTGVWLGECVGGGRGELQEKAKWSWAPCAGAPTLMGTGSHSEAGGTSISLDFAGRLSSKPGD